MADVIGYLKDDATFGEKKVLKTLSSALPQDFQVYVECPLRHKGMERMPDFIVLTNFGIVILEVKDWVQIVRADKYYAEIRSRRGKIFKKKNPVRQARQFAEILASKLQDEPGLIDRRRHKLKIPWGYAAVFPNLRPASITQLRRPWGQVYVVGLADLQSPRVTQCLKATLPFDYDLRRRDLQYVRAVINPSVSITVEVAEGKVRDVTLDETQERLVAEAPGIGEGAKESQSSAAQVEQASFLPSTPEPDTAPVRDEAAVAPPEVEAMMHNAAVRLVRGVAGSGKTLVLTQRARYLAAQHSQWQIAVLTFNKRLAQILQANLKGMPNVKVTHFDKLCAALLCQTREWRSPQGAEGWIRGHADEWPIVEEMGAEFLADEIKWIKEMNFASREAYLAMERKGRGGTYRLRRGGRRRKRIYDLLQAYNAWLAQGDIYDWADVPHLVLAGIDGGDIQPPAYDALLIDEAQDFAPSWVQVVKRLLRPEGSVIFMADDPSQSIYRYYSWREKGVPVVGRTRWLRIPYRNTREIYQTAYEVIRQDEILRRQLEEQVGAAIAPDLSSEYLRSGPRPQLRAFHGADDEFAYIRSQVEWLLQQGYDAREIIVLHRRRAGVRRLRRALRGTDVDVATLHGLKGLEFEVAFVSEMQEMFPAGIERSEQALSEERRLVYVAMTRARERLYLTHSGQWPAALDPILPYVESSVLE